MSNGFSQKGLLSVFKTYGRFVLNGATLTKTYNSLCKLINKGKVKHCYYTANGEVFELTSTD